MRALAWPQPKTWASKSLFNLTELQEGRKYEILKSRSTRRLEGVITANSYSTKSWHRAWIFKLVQISLWSVFITFAKISWRMCSPLSLWFMRDVCVGSWQKANKKKKWLQDCKITKCWHYLAQMYCASIWSVSVKLKNFLTWCLWIFLFPSSYLLLQILELVKGMHYQLACQKYFELTHNVSADLIWSGE